MFQKVQRLTKSLFKRAFSLSSKSDTKIEKPLRKGLVVGAYNGCDKSVASKYSSEIGIDINSLVSNNTALKPGEVRTIIDNMPNEFKAVALVGLGPDYRDVPGKIVYERRENVRNAAGAGAMALQERGIDEIFVEHMVDGEAAAEGATLGVWFEQQSKSCKTQLTESKVYLYEKGGVGKHAENWKKGFEKAKGQNLARYFMANLMTPTIFGQRCAEELSPCGVSVDVHDHKWIKQKGMEAFLTMARGAGEPPVLVELKYNGGGTDHVVIVGQGCSCDPAGNFFSHWNSNLYNCADKAGAAATVGLLKALWKLNIPATITALLPIYEIFSSESSEKNGTVVKSMNGRKIKIVNPEEGGRVVLSDVLSYAACLNPKQVISIAPLSSIDDNSSIRLGVSGVFSTNEKLCNILHKSAHTNHDWFWPFPFKEDVLLANAEGADFGNDIIQDSDSTIFGAAFLKEFAPSPPVHYIHLDLNRDSMTNITFPTKYLRDGYPTGRPVRTLVDYFAKLNEAKAF